MHCRQCRLRTSLHGLCYTDKQLSAPGCCLSGLCCAKPIRLHLTMALRALDVFQGRDQRAQEISKTSLHRLSGLTDNSTKPKNGEIRCKLQNISQHPLELNMPLYRLQSKKTREDTGHSESVHSKPRSGAHSKAARR